MESSTLLIKPPVPKSQNPRAYYLANPKTVKPPWIGHSKFVPASMVEHLMRKKKNSALAVKFQARNNPPDAITNMEGVLHTFVTPIVEANMHGVYAWRGGHGVVPFGSDRKEGTQLAMPCLISAMIHPDFELGSVMVRAIQVMHQDKSEDGDATMPELLSVEQKQVTTERAKYDDAIRRVLIYNLTATHSLPSIADINRSGGDYMTLSVAQAVKNLGNDILSPGAEETLDWSSLFLVHQKRTLSFEMLLNVYVHQIRNEFTLLSEIAASSGYVYTYNPPAIFARWLGTVGMQGAGTILLSLVWALALKQLASEESHIFKNCKCIAWDTFATPMILPLIRNALKPLPDAIPVIGTTDLFKYLNTPVDTERKDMRNPFYHPPPGCEDAIVVLHNNSDAFGQNVETEHASGSLDGAIGANSSMAASLLRSREDLCSQLREV